MKNPFTEAIERLTGKKVIEPKMSLIHDEDDKTPIDELLDLAYRTRDSLREKIKKGKPGKKLSFVHTGMLDQDGKPIKKKEIKAQEKAHKKQYKARKKRTKAASKILKKGKDETPAQVLQRLEDEIAELEKRV